jgi:hypothetical protein
MVPLLGQVVGTGVDGEGTVNVIPGTQGLLLLPVVTSLKMLL